MLRKLSFIVILSTFVHTHSQVFDPLRTSDYHAQEKWVDSILNSMTIDQKIGQLFMIQAYSNLDSKHESTIKKMIQQYHVGNLIFMQGTPIRQALLTNAYQSLSEVPLMIGFDGEWGLNMRLENTHKFPWNMTLGAIQDNALIRKFGERLGKHARRMGIHVNFAPVVDININPENPIIGNRSFGEDKKNVTQKAIAFSQGMQSQGILSSAKHFPGHGDTASDSHLKLPVLDFDWQRLDSIELYPYKKVFDAGAASVMTAHLSIPTLEPNESLPTSLSHAVITELLKEKLGFLGLVFTDGLNMKGVANYSTSEQVNLAAFQAGNDILLIPQEIPTTVAMMKNFLAEGRLTEQRIDESVRKILLAKYKVGLHRYQPIDTLNLIQDLNAVEDEILHRELVRASITVIKNKKRILPIKDLGKSQKIAYVPLGDDSGKDFLTLLRKYSDVTKVSGDQPDEIIEQLKGFDTVIIGYHKPNNHPWQSFKFKNNERVLLDEIARKKRTILSVFASPYSLLDLKTFSHLEGVLIGYQNSKIAQEITAQIIFGAIDARGKLPVSIGEEFPAGTGIKTVDLQRLQYSFPEAVEMSSDMSSKIDSIAKIVLEKKMAPGLQVLIARKGQVVFQKSYGFHTHKKKDSVKNTDVYDLASLTKILASLPMIMKAEEENKLKLSSSIEELLPKFKNSNKDTVTVQEMLSHYGRLQAWIPFYKLTQDSEHNVNLEEFYSSKKTKTHSVQVAKNLYLISSYKDSIYEYIRVSEQREKHDYKYSDLGYYILKETLERTYKKGLDVLVQDHFYRSLGAYRMTYLPLDKVPISSIVPTENDSYYRNQLLRGHVHDMGAAMLGGVGGHAGLFANANDVAKVMQLYLQKGFYGGKRYFSPQTFDKFNKRYYKENQVRRGLGFDKPQLNQDIKATCGCVSDESFGHSGFTGTFTWADPKSGIVYVFLSNRVYPTMNNLGLVEADIRTKIQKIIQDSILPE